MRFSIASFNVKNLIGPDRARILAAYVYSLSR
mgnify:CR=1 FL=1